MTIYVSTKARDEFGFDFLKYKMFFYTFQELSGQRILNWKVGERGLPANTRGLHGKQLDTVHEYSKFVLSHFDSPTAAKVEMHVIFNL